jgi:hypothetical protein
LRNAHWRLFVRNYQKQTKAAIFLPTDSRSALPVRLLFKVDWQDQSHGSCSDYR